MCICVGEERLVSGAAEALEVKGCCSDLEHVTPLLGASVSPSVEWWELMES